MCTFMYLEHCAINYFLKSTKENLPAAPDSAICLKYILSNSSLYQHTWWRLLTPPTYRMETPHSTNMQDGDSSLHQHTGWRLRGLGIDGDWLGHWENWRVKFCWMQTGTVKSLWMVTGGLVGLRIDQYWLGGRILGGGGHSEGADRRNLWFFFCLLL